MQCIVVGVTGVYTVSLDSRARDSARRSNMFVRGETRSRRDAFAVALN